MCDRHEIEILLRVCQDGGFLTCSGMAQKLGLSAFLGFENFFPTPGDPLGTQRVHGKCRKTSVAPSAAVLACDTDINKAYGAES